MTVETETGAIRTRGGTGLEKIATATMTAAADETEATGAREAAIDSMAASAEEGVVDAMEALAEDATGDASKRKSRRPSTSRAKPPQT